MDVRGIVDKLSVSLALLAPLQAGSTDGPRSRGVTPPSLGEVNFKFDSLYVGSPALLQ